MKTSAKTVILWLLPVLLFAISASATNKWNQPFDRTTYGVDIRCDQDAAYPRALADDFKCTITGKITDVNIYGSWLNDNVGQISEFHLEIWSDIPRTATSPSKPGQMLWQKSFYTGQFTETQVYQLPNGYEWWWDPYAPVLNPNGDRKIWRYHFTISAAEAYKQTGTANTPKVYWLKAWVKISSTTPNTFFGWKTSYKHWNDAACFWLGGNWQPLRYPTGHPYAQKNIDLAFDIKTSASSPCIVLDGYERWKAALMSQSVQPMSAVEWSEYISRWQNPTEGEPYPSTNFQPPVLSVFQNPVDPCNAGLVMSWNPPTGPGSSTAGAWIYQYALDPDFTDCTITINVMPPCTSGISVVSLGLKDISGNVRAWYWNVPATLPCGLTTPISIDTSVVGIAAATPLANSFLDTPGFDITQVTGIMFDENATWVGGITAPVPGSPSLYAAWNYWHDLTVTPNPTDSNVPLKWSQPAMQLDDRTRIYGWDEKSVRTWLPLVADDWHCKDTRPITDIHWWGSFIGWDKPEIPLLPDAFHISIWTDVPATSTGGFSHPGKMVWYYICEDYSFKHIGYDKDPRQSTIPRVADSCFKFDCNLPDPNWFYQQPETGRGDRVYWLAISAIYSTSDVVTYPWGWKTRPSYYNDAAVRIMGTDMGWPPVLNCNYTAGNPVMYQKVKWDMAFELTTNKAFIDPPVDNNWDGIVNWIDLANMANNWLKIRP